MGIRQIWRARGGRFVLFGVIHGKVRITATFKDNAGNANLPLPTNNPVAYPAW